MSILLWIVLVPVLLSLAAVANGSLLREWCRALREASEARERRAHRRYDGWTAWARDEAMHAAFASRAPRTTLGGRLGGAWAKLRRAKAPDRAPAPAAVVPVEPQRLAGALVRYFSFIFIAATGLVNFAAEGILVALSYAEYLGDPVSYPAWLARLFTAPALLLSVAVLAGMVVWGILALEAAGLVQERTFESPWMLPLSFTFLGVGAFVVVKSGEVRGLSGLPTGSAEGAARLLQAVGAAKMDMAVALAVLVSATSVIGLLALKKLLAISLAMAAAFVVGAASGALRALVEFREWTIRAGAALLDLFLDLARVAPAPPPAGNSPPNAQAAPDHL